MSEFSSSTKAPMTTDNDALPQPPPRAWPRSRMLNVWVDNLSMAELMATLDAGIVWTLNPDHLYHLQRNRAFYDAYRQADFITSDSKYVYWGLGWVGRRIKEKVSGSDIVPAYCAHHAKNPDVKVFLLGAAPGIAQMALEKINRRTNSRIVVGAHSPSMKFVGDEVGLGAPKQEIWIVKHRHLMPKVKVYMGVGATIDYEADAVKRAPRWMTRRGLEWVYRITTEPRRYWRRYLRDMEYFWLLLKDAMGLYRSPWGQELKNTRPIR